MDEDGEPRFQNENLSNLDMNHAIMINANMKGAIICETIFDYANMDDVALSHASMENSYMYAVYMPNALLVGAKLNKMTFISCFMRNANLCNSLWTDCYLENVDLENAYLTGATFINCVFSNVNFKHALFINKVSFVHSNTIANSNLTGTLFKNAIINDMVFSNNTYNGTCLVAENKDLFFQETKFPTNQQNVLFVNEFTNQSYPTTTNRLIQTNSDIMNEEMKNMIQRYNDNIAKLQPPPNIS
jgi:uncharacterized protein YjbI with pentapeptide repeats